MVREGVDAEEEEAKFLRRPARMRSKRGGALAKTRDTLFSKTGTEKAWEGCSFSQEGVPINYLLSSPSGCFLVTTVGNWLLEFKFSWRKFLASGGGFLEPQHY